MYALYGAQDTGIGPGIEAQRLCFGGIQRIGAEMGQIGGFGVV